MVSLNDTPAPPPAADRVLDDGRKMSEVMTRWYRLLAVAALLEPAVVKQADRGILDPLTDLDLLKLKLIAAVVAA